MWLFTEKGFLSAVRKGHGDQNMVIRARNIDALKDLSEFSMTAIVRTPKADYPFRLHVTPHAWAEYVKSVAMAVDYRNFKTQVKKTLGQDQADALGQVWKAMLAVQDEDARAPLTTEYLEQPVDHYFYEVWSPNGECVSDGICSEAELPRLRRNVEAEWLELTVWPQPKYARPDNALSHISEGPHAPLVGSQWLPLIKAIVSLLEALERDNSRFFRVDFYSPLFSQPVYVQAKQFDNGIFTIEAVSNKFLATKLTNEQKEALLFLGWDLRGPNYTLTFELEVTLNSIAEKILNTMVLVYRIDESCLFAFKPARSISDQDQSGLVSLPQNPSLFRLQN
jgi:hypothetical protein